MKRLFIILALTMLPLSIQAQDWGYFPLGGGVSSLDSSILTPILDDIYSRSGGTGITTSVLADSGDANYVRAEVDPIAMDTAAAHEARISATEQVADAAVTPTQLSDTADVLVRAEVDPIAMDTAAAHEARIAATEQVADAALPTASIPAVLDTAFTDQARDISSTGRIFARQDSVTFLGEAGDVIDLSTGNSWRGTLSQDDTLSFTGGVDGQVFQVTITNAGAFTLYVAGVGWPGDTAPVITAVANKRTKLSFEVCGGMIDGVSALNYP